MKAIVYQMSPQYSLRAEKGEPITTTTLERVTKITVDEYKDDTFYISSDSRPSQYDHVIRVALFP